MAAFLASSTTLRGGGGGGGIMGGALKTGGHHNRPKTPVCLHGVMSGALKTGGEDITVGPKPVFLFKPVFVRKVKKLSWLVHCSLGMSHDWPK